LRGFSRAAITLPDESAILGLARRSCVRARKLCASRALRRFEEIDDMTIRMFAAALAAGLTLGGIGAPAQTTTGTLVEPEVLALPQELASPQELALPEEHDALLRDHIRRRPVERIAQIPGGPPRPGKILPRDVRLSPLANLSVEGLNRYAYIVSPDDKIVLVDPATRRVVRVLDR
jgi:Protein of unknown function (DUF1236)